MAVHTPSWIGVLLLNRWIYLSVQVMFFIIMLCSSSTLADVEGEGREAVEGPGPAKLALMRFQKLAAAALRSRGYSDLAEVTVGDRKELGRWGNLASSALGSKQGDKANDALMTLDLPNSPLAELSNVMDLYQTVFGVVPDFSNVTDARSFYKRIQDIIYSSVPSISFDCQPSFRVWSKEINVAFPDQHSLYHLMVLPAFGPNDLVLIEGTFPDTRYFSFQSYDSSFRPVSKLRDAMITPAGSLPNPFVVPPKEGATKAMYQIYLTKDGKRGFPNELAATKSMFNLPGLTVVMMRLFGVDPRADLSKPELEPYRYVSPVRVSMKVMGTVSPRATDLAWQTFSSCPINNTLALRDALTAATSLTTMVEDPKKQFCRSENVPNNFVLYQREDHEVTSRAPFTNTDATYLLACANNRPAYLKNHDLIVYARAHLPTTPVGLLDKPYVGNPKSYQVRYVSLSVYDLNVPGPVLRTVSDDEFRVFYEKIYGPEWETSFRRNVSLIVAKNQDVLKRCRIDTSQSFIVELDRQKPLTDWFGVVYRELLPQGQALKNSAFDASKEGPNEHLYTQSVFDAKKAVCTADEEHCDSSPYRIAQTMKSHMPRISYYFCSPEGKLTEAPQGVDPFANKGYPVISDVFEDGDPSQQSDYLKFCNATGVNYGLVRVYSPSSWVHLYHHQQPHSPPKVEVVRPGLVHVWSFPVDTTSKYGVFGLSPKALTADKATFIVEVDLCGNTFISDAHWRCTDHPLPDDSWLLPSFNDSDWLRVERSLQIPDLMEKHIYFSRESHLLSPSPQDEEKGDQALKAWRENYFNNAVHVFDINGTRNPAVVKAMKAQESDINNNNKINDTIWTDVTKMQSKQEEVPPSPHVWDAVKPRQLSAHGYYCRLMIPNPTYQDGRSPKAGRSGA